MEKHTCKLCFRRFSNGRALGGHMRSHAMESTSRRPLIKESYSSPPISSSSSGKLEVDQLVSEGMGQNPTPMIDGVGSGGGVGRFEGYYVPRRKRRRSFKFVDPEFSGFDDCPSVFQIARVNGTNPDTHNRNKPSSVVVQDRESKTESSIPTSTSSSADHRRQRTEMIEPVSSASDTTPDEDGALSLMMLSRDFWPNNNLIDSPIEQEKEDFIVSSSEKEEGRRTRVRKITVSNGGKRSRYYCGTCKRIFRSYQALGGHRASHKKIPSCNESGGDNNHRHNDQHRRSKKIRQMEEATEENEVRLHECPYCYRVFNSGQALGGHKRSHLVAGHSLPPFPPPPSPVVAKIESSLIDLNLPALPSEDEEEEDSSAISN